MSAHSPAISITVPKSTSTPNWTVIWKLRAMVSKTPGINCIVFIWRKSVLVNGFSSGRGDNDDDGEEYDGNEDDDGMMDDCNGRDGAAGRGVERVGKEKCALDCGGCGDCPRA